MLTPKECANFESHGFDLSQLLGIRLEDGAILLDCYQQDLPLLWLFTAKLGAPELEYHFTSDDSIDIGGTGLFSSDR